MKGPTERGKQAAMILFQLQPLTRTLRALGFLGFRVLLADIASEPFRQLPPRPGLAVSCAGSEPQTTTRPNDNGPNKHP